jgi:hypothetical protein
MDPLNSEHHTYVYQSMQDAGINLIYQMEDKNGIIVEMILG